MTTFSHSSTIMAPQPIYMMAPQQQSAVAPQQSTQYACPPQQQHQPLVYYTFTTTQPLQPVQMAHTSYCVAQSPAQQPQTQFFANPEQPITGNQQEALHGVPSPMPKPTFTTTPNSALMPLTLQPQPASATSPFNGQVPGELAQQWSTTANSPEPPTSKLVYSNQFPPPLQQAQYQQQLSSQYMATTSPYEPQQPQAMQYVYVQQPPQQPSMYQPSIPSYPPTLPWRSKRKVYRRTDRLRRLADDLAHKDAQFSEFIPYGEKDNLNTSTSETSPSQMLEAPNGTVVDGANKPTHVEAYDDEDDDDLDNQNQTVSELLSMLSGSGDSHRKEEEEEKKLGGTSESSKGGLVISDENGAAPLGKHATEQSPPSQEAAGNQSLNQFMMQDQAIKEIQTVLPEKATASIAVSSSEQLQAQQHAKKFKQKRTKSPVILAEDEAIGKMRYYDKSSCMHAPKACHVPKF